MNSTSMFKRTEVIGRGKFGVVYKGYNKQTKQVVAIKVLNLDAQDEDVSDVQQEIQFLTELKNVPNVTHYHGSFLHDTKLWIIMDYCAGGSVRTLLKCGVFEERYIGVILRELLIALQSVHKMGVIHRDLKAANVLITKEGNVELCDFGVAAQMTSNSWKRSTIAGTPYWMAPEVIREGDVYNHKADIWSLGITLYEITTGNPPYSDKDAMWAMQMISKLTPPRLEGREYSAILKETIALCLDENPEERPSAEDLLKCKLVKQYRNTPTLILKELVTRYLLWRDQNKRRDSIAFLNLEEEKQISAAGLDKNAATEEEIGQFQVRWDFDSLSSKEYIMENEIDMENVQKTYNFLSNFDEDHGGTINDLTIQHNRFGVTSNITTTSNTTMKYGTSPNHNLPASQPGTLPNTDSSRANTEMPKSLQLLFEDLEPAESEELPRPLIGVRNATTDRVESPTIEIPDMDSLADYSKAHQTLGNGNSQNHTLSHSLVRPGIAKPPTLHHSQSASGNLEMRASSANRQRKKTISNSLNTSSIASTPTQPPNQLGHPVQPKTPPYGRENSSRTPSPNPAAPNSTLGSLANPASPSKSMKALNHSLNPLLQPINFKPPQSSISQMSSQASQGTNSESESVHTSPSNHESSTNTSLNSINERDITSKKKRGPPGLRIQMPTPSSTISSLNALTSEFDTQNLQSLLHHPTPLTSTSSHHPQHLPHHPHPSSEVNQFGISLLQATQVPMAMTPVTEKDPHVQGLAEEETDGQIQPAVARERTDSLSGRVYPGTSSRKPSLTNGTVSGRSTSISASPINVTKPVTKFPTIPSVNPDFFSDSTPKLRLVSELDLMIKLFSQGLDTLEENLNRT